jgi:hypothetical protein
MYEYMKENDYPISINTKIGYAGEERKLDEPKASAMDGRKLQ